MNASSPLRMSWLVVIAGSVVLLAVGAASMYGGMRWASTPPTRPTSSISGAAVGPAESTPAPSLAAVDVGRMLPDVIVPLGKDAAARAGITVTTVVAEAGVGELRVPGTIEPDAYRVIPVTSLVAGRVLTVSAELGQRVDRGAVLATIFSPELAEWETRHVALRAELDAHERELARTERLVQLGSASQQELERLHAEHTSRRAALQSSTSRLRLLGLSAEGIGALDGGTEPNAAITVIAPGAGVITERLVNTGANVEAATKLFTVVDLANVWVVADVYEQDFARARVGATARVTTPAYPGLTVTGRISYVDPQVTMASRTARVRVEVPNPRGDFRLGMLAEATIGTLGDRAVTIPQTAVQHAGDRTVVYLVDAQHDGQFVEREVELGPQSGSRVSVRAGVHVGDVVVSQGSFSVRAERERLGLRGAIPPKRPMSPAAPTEPGQAVQAIQTVRISVTEKGYEPARVSLRAGIPARILVTRTTDDTCGTEIVFPDLNVTRALPLKTAVAIEFTPKETGELTFVCGLGMLKGAIVVR